MHINKISEIVNVCVVVWLFFFNLRVLNKKIEKKLKKKILRVKKKLL